MAENNPQSQEENIDPIKLFTSAVQTVVEGLAYLGHISETVTLAGHRFTLQTLRPEYTYAIAQVVQPYRNTFAADKAWRNAHVACALTSVDGNSHFCDPISDRIEDFVLGRFNYVSDKKTGWSEPTLEFLWVNYQLLELKAAKAVDQLNFLSQQTPEKPAFLQDLEDILKESASLENGTNGDTPISPISNGS